MNTNKMILASAFAAAIAIPAAISAHTQAMEPTFKAEKCYGIAKAGKNDCASTGNNSCAGMSKKDADKKSWVFVPTGYCDRLVGGSTKPAM